MPQSRRIAIALRIDEPYPQHQQVFAGVQRFAKELGNWHCVIDEHPGLHQRRRGPAYGNYDGVIARSTIPTQQRLRRLGIPLVNTHYQTAQHGTPGVHPDPAQIGRLAAEHLIERGFRRLIVVGDETHLFCSYVIQAFQRYAEQQEIVCETRQLKEEYYHETAYWLNVEKIADELVKNLQPPVGLFVETAPAARMIIQRCTARGLHVPQQVAVLCQQYLKAVVDVAPQISSIEPNYERVGYEAARLLADLLAGKPPPAEPLLLPLAWVNPRESTDYYAVEDQLVARALRYISTNLHAPLRLEKIAYNLAVSPRQLQIRFGKALGRGISEEIRRLRLEAVKRLLMEPTERIGDIAVRTGFGQPQVLNAVFRRELGMTPRAYRAQMTVE